MLRALRSAGRLWQAERTRSALLRGPLRRRAGTSTLRTAERSATCDDRPRDGEFRSRRKDAVSPAQRAPALRIPRGLVDRADTPDPAAADPRPRPPTAGTPVQWRARRHTGPARASVGQLDLACDCDPAAREGARSRS